MTVPRGHCPLVLGVVHSETDPSVRLCHTSDVAVRFQDHVLPFFSRTLSIDPAKR